MNKKFCDEIYDFVKSCKGGASFQKIEGVVKNSKNLSDNEKVDIKATVREALKVMVASDEYNFDLAKGRGKKKTIYKVKQTRNRRPESVISSIPDETNDTMYKGRAGEYAVMSELLFRGFDANLMTVDKGQDIIAHKNGTYYLIQVKTTSPAEDGHVTWNIPKVTINKFFDDRMRYVLVIRCLFAGKRQNIFFCFNSTEIEMLANQNYISKNAGNITVKIKYEDKVPYLYNRNLKQDVSKWENFDSIIGRKIDK